MHDALRTVAYAALVLLLGCSPSTPQPSPSAIPAPALAPAATPSTITLATTTSTRDSGLLDELIPQFERESGVTVKVVAVGSGQALELGRKGDADVLLTHSPKAEEQFMSDGHGFTRQAVMHNDFVIVGPAADPADLKASKTVVEAIRRLRMSESVFVSRGDESGTHTKELAIWKQAGIEPQGDWYLRGGSGMAATLRLAHEKRAYTLADRATFLVQAQAWDLVIVSEGDSMLLNPYAVIVVSPEKHPRLNPVAARSLAEFLLLPTTQAAIGAFGIETYGQPLFFPNPKP